jgi:hypothetical protein
MTPAELAALLSVRRSVVTAADVWKVLTVHPAFIPDDEDRFILGKPASVPAITAGRNLPVRPTARSWALPSLWPSRSAPSRFHRPHPGKAADNERAALLQPVADQLRPHRRLRASTTYR